MKININIEIEGKELIELSVIKLKNQNFDFPPNDFQFLVFSEKAGKEVEIKPEHIKLVRNKTTVS